MRHYTLFYSWQNEEKKPKSIIYKAIRIAQDKLSQRGIEIALDQDTRNRVGIRKIDVEIIDKINRCDIFLCDLSPVITKEPQDEDGLKRHMPNSNVLYEFGYAMGVLGQDYIISLARFAKGEHIELMPFDIKTFTITEFSKVEDLKDLDLWIENICKSVDKKREGMTPDYDMILGIKDGDKSASLSAEIHPVYSRIVNYHKKEEPVNRVDEYQGKEDVFKTAVTGSVLELMLQQAKAEALQPTVIAKPILKDVYHSFCPIDIVIFNQGKLALENVTIFINSDNPDVRFRRTNEEDKFGFADIMKPGDLCVEDTLVSKRYDILNPKATYTLRTFYVYAPHGTDSFHLKWHANTKVGQLEGVMTVSVIPDYHYEETWSKNLPDGDERFEEYIEHVTDDGEKK